MTERVKVLIEQVKSLTVEERVELVRELLDEDTRDVSMAWADEAQRRGDEATASGDRGVDWESVREQLLA